MKFIRKHPYASGAAIAGIGLLVFLTATNPDNVPVGLLVVPAVLLFFISFCVAQIGLGFLGIQKGDLRKRRVVAMVGASFVTVGIILESTGGISAADVVLLALILTVVAVYINKF